MLTTDLRISKMQNTLRRFEDDIPLLNMRVKELSTERQEAARQFASALIETTRAELEKLLRQRPEEAHYSSESPCEPAD